MSQCLFLEIYFLGSFVGLKYPLVILLIFFVGVGIDEGEMGLLLYFGFVSDVYLRYETFLFIIILEKSVKNLNLPHTLSIAISSVLSQIPFPILTTGLYLS